MLFEEAGTEDGHGAFAILELGAFVLHADDDTGGEVGDADGGVGGVDGLTAVAAGAEDVDAEVFRFDFDIFFFGFGEDGDGDGASVNATLRFGDGDALDAVDATFEFEAAVGFVAGEAKNDFFEATSVVFVDGFCLNFQIVGFGVAEVHTVEFGGKKGGFVAASAGADLDDGGFVICGVAGE